MLVEENKLFLKWASFLFDHNIQWEIWKGARLLLIMPLGVSDQSLKSNTHPPSKE
ncbi:unnamed protein product, partial [Musa banksii]